MNVALPTLIVFLLVLPGFIIRSRFKRAERTSLDYSPFGEIVTEAILWTGLAHFLLLLCLYLVLDRKFQLDILLNVLCSDNASQASAIKVIAAQANWVYEYFGTLFIGAFALPKFARFIVMRARLDRDSARFGWLFRFHKSPWYYILSGADFEKADEPDFVCVSAIVNVSGEPFLFTGVLDNYFFDSDGNLDRLILENAMRRPLSADKKEKGEHEGEAAGSSEADRFYVIDGDYFVLRYSEAITINIEYIKLEMSDALYTEQERSE